MCRVAGHAFPSDQVRVNAPLEDAERFSSMTTRGTVDTFPTETAAKGTAADLLTPDERALVEEYRNKVAVLQAGKSRDLLAIIDRLAPAPNATPKE